MHTLKPRKFRQMENYRSDTLGDGQLEHPRFSYATWGLVAVGVSAAVGVAGTVIASDSSRKSLHAQEDALKSQQELAASLKYEPIDIEKLKTDASTLAAQNAAASLALERSLQPGVADTREGLQKRVASELALGGKLSPDVANQVAAAGRTAGSASGIGGNSAGVTAALTGQTAQDLLQQRENNAFSLLSANPLPTAGLDPGALASAEIANNSAQNQFNLAKAGVSSNLINSQAQVQSAAAGSNASMWNGILSTVGNAASGLINYAKTPTTTGTTTANPGLFNFSGSVPQVSANGLWG
jgi:hypothetical protein